MNTTNKASQSIAVCALALLIGAFSASASAACNAPPEAATASIDRLIERTSRIVLVRADAVGREIRRAETEKQTLLDRARELKKITETARPSGDRAVTDIRVTSLTVIENLKGTGDQQLYLPNHRLRFQNAQNDFAAHSDAEFWNDNTSGRVGYDDDCKIVINFDAGQTYLVFLGPFHVKAYELITQQDDRWLAFVRERTGHLKAKPDETRSP